MIESFPHRSFLVLHRQVITHYFDDLFVTWLETQSLVCFFVEKGFKLNDHHHVIKVKNNGLSNLADVFDAVPDIIKVFIARRGHSVTLIQCELLSAGFHLSLGHIDAVLVSFNALAKAHQLWLHDKHRAIFVLNQIFDLFDSGFDQIYRTLLLRKQLEQVQESADPIVVKVSSDRCGSDRTAEASWLVSASRNDRLTTFRPLSFDALLVKVLA